jgi:hypothetical protein
LLPGERVNTFFAADENHPRGYLIHFQDELCQMKGHGHVWEVRKVTDDGRGFTARVLAGGKPLDDKELIFQLDPKCQIRRAEKKELRAGDHLYLTWCLRDGKRVVMLIADDASLDTIKKEEQERVAEQVAKEGLGGRIEGVEGKTVQFMVFATHWAQAGQLKAGQDVRLMRTGKGYRPTGDAIEAKVVSQKNRGVYGSGVNDVVLELKRPEDGKALASWMGEAVVRLIPR